MSSARVFHAVIDGKYWRIAAVHGAPTRRWAWLVNIDRQTEQVRLSMRHPELQRFDQQPAQMIFAATNMQRA